MALGQQTIRTSLYTYTHIAWISRAILIDVIWFTKLSQDCIIVYDCFKFFKTGQKVLKMKKLRCFLLAPVSNGYDYTVYFPKTECQSGIGICRSLLLCDNDFKWTRLVVKPFWLIQLEEWLVLLARHLGEGVATEKPAEQDEDLPLSEVLTDARATPDTEWHKGGRWLDRPSSTLVQETLWIDNVQI